MNVRSRRSGLPSSFSATSTCASLKAPPMLSITRPSVLSVPARLALPAGAQIHHVDEKPSNNIPSNLVVCPDDAYHKLIHQRMRALAACGDPSWRKCPFCKQYDDTKNLSAPRGPRNQTFHPHCKNAYNRKRLAARGIIPSTSLGEIS